MKRIVLAFLVFIGGCAPTSQRDIFAENRQKMAEISQSCIESTAQEKHPNRAAVDCRFSGYISLLKAAGFKDLALLVKLHYDYDDIADALDSKKINEPKADKLYAQANREFYAGIQGNDSMRSQDYAAEMAAIGSIANSTSSSMQAVANARAAAYSNAGASCPSCQEGIAQEQQFIQQEQTQQQQSEQQRQMQEQQQQIQQQQKQIDQWNSWSPAHRLWGSSYQGP